MAERIGSKIAEGRTAEIFAYGEGKVVKLFRARFPRSAAERDYSTSLSIASVYPGAPAVHGKVEIDGRLGIVLERLSGKSLVQVMASRPWKALWAADLCAELHHDVLALTVDGLPPQKGGIEWAVTHARELDEKEKRRIVSHLHALPDGGSLCHGDFHPDNVFLSQRGPVVIDWMTATRGCPAGDLARSLLIAQSPSLPPGMPAALAPLVMPVKNIFSRRYERGVLAACGVTKPEIEAWMLPLAAARLIEWSSPAETAYLLRIIRKKLGALRPGPRV